MLTPDRITKIRTFLAASAETSRGVERDLIADCKADGDDPEQSDDVGDQRLATAYVEDAGEALAAYARVTALLARWEEEARTTPLGEEADVRYRSAYNVIVAKARELRAALEGTP